MATFCPYCKEEIEEAIHREWHGHYWTHKDDFQCPICGKEIEIDVEQEPFFLAHRKDGRTSQ